jgi:hypothetical protein
MGGDLRLHHLFAPVLLCPNALRVALRSSGQILPANVGSWDLRGGMLRDSVSLVVTGFAASVGTAAAQYLPPRAPPVGYPPPGYYGYRAYPPPANYRANPSAPSQGADQDADGQLMTIIMSDLTPHNQGLAMRRVASDRSR